MGLVIQLQLTRSTGLLVMLTCVALACLVAQQFQGTLSERIVAAGLLAAGLEYCEGIMLAFAVSAGLLLMWRGPRSHWAATVGSVATACIALAGWLWPEAVRSQPVAFALLHVGRGEMGLLVLLVAAALAWRRLEPLGGRYPETTRVAVCLAVALGAIVSLGLREVVAHPAQTLLDWVHLPHLAPRTDWREAQLWAKANTRPSDLFIVPVDSEGFRVFSERGQVVDWKDGSEALFNYRFAREWERRIADFAALEKCRGPEFEARLRQLAQTYDAAYAVVAKPRNLTQPSLYENSTYAIYALK
jgi:hypothetical protein